MAKNYVKFTENNEWEGETWHFFIPEAGNEKTLEKIANLIEDTDMYELKLKKVYTEEQVDLLVAESDGGYMHTYNKVKAIGKLPRKVKWGNVEEDGDDPFYKGKAFELEERFHDEESEDEDE